ncbi:hypothetical protein PsorP6_007138 [Peronosclerospora sorghi]|uniref:Uncharacterized protein n=1 Tax=Peronosclerospora sorghi TaxID=230839 RepID=A0ACC0W896_9STRA|nr:hypothetical protein PsorP6_007138 [Peronosclerospora sorghi]
MKISQKVVAGVYPVITTSELDKLAAATAAYQGTQHLDFSNLAARIAVSNLHKIPTKSFNVHEKTGSAAPVVADDVYEIVMHYRDEFNSAMIHDREFEYALKQCACISKWAEAIGFSIHTVRVTNSYIRGTHGSSSGIIPMLREEGDRCELRSRY